MYLLSHLWWYLLLAFSLGALIGYALWRFCSRPMLESRYERSRKDLNWRLQNLEEERANFVSPTTSSDNTAELAKLRSELASLKQRNGTDETDRQKLTQSLIASHEAEVRKAREEAAAEASRKHTEELKKAREQVAAEFNAKHADDIKKARDQVAAEWTSKHTAELKKARDDVTASLTSAHTGEVKKLQETAKAHESKVLLLSQADGSVRKELDAAKARHADELKKTRDQIAAEWTAKHSAELKKAREDAAADAARHHAEELKKARDQVAAEWTSKHNAELKKARDDVTASLTAAHAGDVKKLQDAAKAHESKVVLLSQADTSARQELDAVKTRHADEVKKTREQVAAEWTAKHAADIKRAREEATSEAARHHAEELKRARDQVTAEWTTKHANDLKKARDEVTASLASAHAGEVKKLQETAKAHESKMILLSQADTSARQELDAAKARHAEELKKARDQLAAEWTAKHAAGVQKAREDAAAEAARHHAEEVHKAREQVTAEWTTKHTNDLKKARDEVTSSLALAHAGEVKKLQETAKAHESKVMLLSQADTSARQELDSAKSRHADELKKTREQVAAEWSTKHTADVKKAREDAAAEAARRHADDLKKVNDQVIAQWTAKHAADVKKAREDAAAEASRHHADELAKAKAAAAAASSSHDAALKAARDAAVAEAARRHNEELAKLRGDHTAALARHADELSKARSAAAVVAAAPKPVIAAATATADDLKLIWGVGPEIEKLLNQNGIHRFEQMANWTTKDVNWFEGLLPAFKGRPESEKWVEQCRKLATGWRPEREIGDKPKDILTSARGGKPDDLKLIWGVGPKLEVMLNKSGFYHFDQIAKWSDREIEWVDTQLGDFAGRAVRDKWVEQCKKLATGWRPSSEVGDKPR
jgi:predicted flap endonuclease-1-like 5' DNA nuclease